MTHSRGASPLRVAILLAAESFEDFFEGQMGFGAEEYISTYRHDWAWDYCAALKAAGVDVVIYVMSYARDGVSPTPDGFAVRFVPVGASYRPWRMAPVLRRTPIGRFVAQVAQTRASFASLRSALRDDRVETLFVQEYWTARLDVLAHRLRRTTVIAIDQGLPDRHEVKAFKRHSLPRVRRVITQTEQEAAKVRGYGGKAERIPNAVDSEYFTPLPVPSREDRTILTTARLDDGQKRISDLIRATAVLGAPWRLDIMGVGRDEAMLRALVADLGLAGSVHFHGFVSDRDAIRAAYRSTGVFALPSAYEGLPVSLLEAMACGAAVVGSDIPAFSEVITNGRDGLVVPVGDVDGLASAIDRAFTERAEFGAQARRTIETTYSRRALGARLRGLTEVDPHTGKR